MLKYSHITHTEAMKSVVWKHTFTAFTTTASLKGCCQLKYCNPQHFTSHNYKNGNNAKETYIFCSLLLLCLVGTMIDSRTLCLFVYNPFHSHCRFGFRLHWVVLIQSNCFPQDLFKMPNHIYWFKNLPQCVAVLFININEIDNVPLALRSKKSSLFWNWSPSKHKSHYEQRTEWLQQPYVYKWVITFTSAESFTRNITDGGIYSSSLWRADT